MECLVSGEDTGIKYVLFGLCPCCGLCTVQHPISDGMARMHGRRFQLLGYCNRQCRQLAVIFGTDSIVAMKLSTVTADEQRRRTGWVIESVRKRLYCLCAGQSVTAL